MVSKELFGLATGIFLTLRYTDSSQGQVGTIKLCTECHVPSTQAHFLDECPVNSGPRDSLIQGVPQGIRVPLLDIGRFSKFFEEIRELEVLALAGIEVTVEKMKPLLKAAVSSSKAFVETTLSKNSPAEGAFELKNETSTLSKRAPNLGTSSNSSLCQVRGCGTTENG